jgi:phospholipid transport system substrate-binding protein
MLRRPSWALLGILSGVIVAASGVSTAETAAPQAGSTETASPEAKTAASEPTSSEAQAGRTVDRLHETLLGVMKNADTLGYQGRRDQLAPELVDLFDLAFMAEKSVGRYWKTASPEERAVLVDTFTRYTIANYAGRFSSYSGQHFETLREEPSTRGTLLVRTRLVDPAGSDDVNLDYRLRSVDGDWKIIDVYLNGTVSELALRRSEYSSLIKREGFQALLAALDERIESLAVAPADQAS